jgi:hypothetical protein
MELLEVQIMQSCAEAYIEPFERRLESKHSTSHSSDR